MKHLPFTFLLFISSFCYSQKYVLIDKKMTQPISYANSVTLEHSYKNLFPVERSKINEFVNEVEKIGAMLSEKDKSKVAPFSISIGRIKFVGVKIPMVKEERLDVVLTSDYEGTKITMHLSDAKISNVSNAFFVNTWAKYIKENVK